MWKHGIRACCFTQLAVPVGDREFYQPGLGAHSSSPRGNGLDLPARVRQLRRQLRAVGFPAGAAGSGTEARSGRIGCGASGANAGSRGGDRAGRSGTGCAASGWCGDIGAGDWNAPGHHDGSGSGIAGRDRWWRCNGTSGFNARDAGNAFTARARTSPEAHRGCGRTGS